MHVDLCHAAGRRYLLISGIHRHVSDPAELARQCASEQDVREVDEVVLITPAELKPEDKTDRLMHLHAYTLAGEAVEPDGIDVLCAFHALQRHEDRTEDSLMLRVSEHLVRAHGLSRGDDWVEATIGRAELDPAACGVDLSGFTSIDPPHTFEIPLEGAADADDDPIIATLVGVDGTPMHAVIFTTDFRSTPLELIGPALDSHPAFPSGVSTHVASLGRLGEVGMKSWRRGVGITSASGVGLAAVTAAGVTMCCTIAVNTATLEEGELEAAMDDDRKLMVRGRVRAMEPSAAR